MRVFVLGCARHIGERERNGIADAIESIVSCRPEALLIEHVAHSFMRYSTALRPAYYCTAALRSTTMLSSCLETIGQTCGSFDLVRRSTVMSEKCARIIDWFRRQTRSRSSKFDDASKLRLIADLPDLAGDVLEPHLTRFNDHRRCLDLLTENAGRAGTRISVCVPVRRLRPRR